MRLLIYQILKSSRKLGLCNPVIFFMVELWAVFIDEINIIDADSILVDIKFRIKLFCTSRTDPVTEYELRMLG